MILESECMMSTVSISESNKENNTDVITNPNSAVPNCTQVGGRSKRYAECEVSSPTATESSSSTSTRQSEDDIILSGFVFTTCIKVKMQRKLNKHRRGIFTNTNLTGYLDICIICL